MKKNAVPTGGFWMETEPLYPEREVFRPVVIKPEKGVVFMRVEKDTERKPEYRETVKVIAI
jgi:hypothetical protein